MWFLLLVVVCAHAKESGDARGSTLVARLHEEACESATNVG
jgi:hypothetical protein